MKKLFTSISNTVGCSAREILSGDGKCEACPEYTRPSTSKSFCIADACLIGLDVLRDGTCPPCEKVSPDNRSCASAGGVCPFQRKVNGKCQAATCVNRERVNLDGSCQECPAYTRPASSRRACIDPSQLPIDNPKHCGEREKILESGSCEDCPDYTRRSYSKRKCISNCGKRAIVLKDGSCEDCPDFSKPDKDQRICFKPPGCEGRSTKLRTGDCQKCEDYSRRQEGENGEDVCGPDTCAFPEYQILLKSGKCQSCPEGAKPSENGKSCDTLAVFKPGWIIGTLLVGFLIQGFFYMKLYATEFNATELAKPIEVPKSDSFYQKAAAAAIPERPSAVKLLRPAGIDEEESKESIDIQVNFQPPGDRAEGDSSIFAGDSSYDSEEEEDDFENNSLSIGDSYIKRMTADKNQGVVMAPSPSKKQSKKTPDPTLMEKYFLRASPTRKQRRKLAEAQGAATYNPPPEEAEKPSLRKIKKQLTSKTTPQKLEVDPTPQYRYPQSPNHQGQPMRSSNVPDQYTNSIIDDTPVRP